MPQRPDAPTSSRAATMICSRPRPSGGIDDREAVSGERLRRVRKVVDRAEEAVREEDRVAVARAAEALQRDDCSGAAWQRGVSLGQPA
eukprot:scaffold89875_cov66-Phaeocystis_antarctica.AAC.6